MCKTLLTLALLLTLTAPAEADGIEVEERFPLRGQPTRLSVTLDGEPAVGWVLEALYRPNSQTSFSETLPPTDASGTVLWTPRDAGIVTLRARQADADSPSVSLNVAVRYGSLSGSGLAIMVLAGLLLFGGVVFGFTRLMGSPPAEEPPST